MFRPWGFTSLQFPLRFVRSLASTLSLMFPSTPCLNLHKVRPTRHAEAVRSLVSIHRTGQCIPKGSKPLMTATSLSLSFIVRSIQLYCRLRGSTLPPHHRTPSPKGRWLNNGLLRLKKRQLHSASRSCPESTG